MLLDCCAYILQGDKEWWKNIRMKIRCRPISGHFYHHWSPYFL